MKVLFLDVDGVLNSQRTFDRMYRYYERTGIWFVELDDEYLSNLATLVQEKDLSIVLSSSWRSHLKIENNLILGIDQKGLALITKLKQYNLVIDDMTPILEGTRQEEIKAWLNEHDVDDYIILDDIKYGLYDLSDHLIQTSFKRGFTKRKLREALKLLDKKVLIKK